MWVKINITAEIKCTIHIKYTSCLIPTEEVIKKYDYI